MNFSFINKIYKTPRRLYKYLEKNLFQIETRLKWMFHTLLFSSFLVYHFSFFLRLWDKKYVICSLIIQQILKLYITTKPVKPQMWPTSNIIFVRYILSFLKMCQKMNSFFLTTLIWSAIFLDFIKRFYTTRRFDTQYS